MRYTFRAEPWLHEGEAAWTFVTLPGTVADDIESRTASARRGFGSVPVTVTVGGTTWRTSLFPDRKATSVLLPIKKQVREAERLREGDVVDVTIQLDVR